MIPAQRFNAGSTNTIHISPVRTTDVAGGAVIECSLFAKGQLLGGCFAQFYLLLEIVSDVVVRHCFQTLVELLGGGAERGAPLGKSIDLRLHSGAGISKGNGWIQGLECVLLNADANEVFENRQRVGPVELRSQLHRCAQHCAAVRRREC